MQRNALILERKEGDLHGYSNMILFLEKNELWAVRTVNDKVHGVDYIDINERMDGKWAAVDDCKG